MRSNKVVYVGNVGVPDTASAIHVYNRALLLYKNNFEVHAVCDRPKTLDLRRSDNVLNYHYLPPIRGKKKIRGLMWNMDQFFAIETYSSIIKEIKKIKPDILILYEVNSIVLQLRLKKYCKSKKIKMIIEVTEWMEVEKRRGILGNLLVIQKDLQKKYIDKKCGNIITISTFLENHYKKQKCNVISIPPLFDTFIEYNKISRQKDNRCCAVVNLVFAGSISHKDFLKELLEALLIINNQEIRISFDIIGPTKNKIMNLININDLEGKGIFVHGRLSHSSTLNIVKKADFSILFRQNKRYAKAGVSTKFCEAMCLGVPSICTKVGGTDLFVEDGKNGFLIEDNTVDNILAILVKILNLNNEDILKMKKNAYSFAKNHFTIDSYVKNIGIFLEKIKNFE